MFTSLRTVLVVLAGMATTLAGVVGSQFAGSFPAPSIHELSGRLAEGTREDDSGRPAEECEEDDTEKQVGRAIHLFATVARTDLGPESGYFAGPETHGVMASLHGGASPIRGPPLLH
jgi:hypothetical protein